jgi:hypothetical protein
VRIDRVFFITLVGFTPAFAQTAALYPSAVPAYEPPTAAQRLYWFAYASAGPPSLAGGVVSAAWGTLFNRPPEYGPTWEGFGKRYGMRLTGVVTSNAMEDALGAVWGEDPRYDRAAGQPFASRVKHVVKMTFLAKDRQGVNRPAYARYAAIAGNNYLSMTWRAQSEAGVGDATIRVGLGFLARMSANAFGEFWPDAKARLFRTRNDRAP